MIHYKELKVWQRSMELVDEIYKIIKKLPAQERYALSEQMRKATISISSKIAEGNRRKSTRDYIRFPANCGFFIGRIR